ncbi:MAG: acyl carrier protein [Desulfobacterales bacterium]|nr:acyl carrier protein [Desulfobacterales bacterium]
MDNFEKKVIEVLADKLDIDSEKITADSLLADDLGLDSLGAVEMLFDLETEYDIEIPNEDAQQFKKTRDIIEYLENKLQKD